MHTKTNIVPENFVPAKTAAAQVAYSVDYVTKLAREGKILARKIDRQWYVDENVLQAFAKRAEKENSRRRAQLRSQRKVEYEVSSALKNNFSSHRIHARIKSGKLFAFANVALVFVCVFTLSVGRFCDTHPAYQANVYAAQITTRASLEETAKNVYLHFSPDRFDRVVQQYNNAYHITSIASGDKTDKRAAVKEAFSDDLTAVFNTEVTNEGVIVPVFRKPGDIDYVFTIDVEAVSQGVTTSEL